MAGSQRKMVAYCPLPNWDPSLCLNDSETFWRIRWVLVMWRGHGVDGRFHRVRTRRASRILTYDFFKVDMARNAISVSFRKILANDKSDPTQNHQFAKYMNTLQGTNISHLGKFGKSSTQNAVQRGYVSSQEGTMHGTHAFHRSHLRTNGTISWQL